MKYAIFGCLLFILGISAIKHESPSREINKLNHYNSTYSDFDLKLVNEQLVIDVVRNHQLPIQPGDVVIKLCITDGMDPGNMIDWVGSHDQKGEVTIWLDELDQKQSQAQIFVSRQDAPEEVLILQRNNDGGWDDVTIKDKELNSYVDSGDR